MTTNYTVRDSTINNYNQLLKDFYLGPIREQLNSETLLMRRLQKNEDIVEGKQVVLPLHISRNAGIQAVGEATSTSNGILPDPGSQGYARSTFWVRYNYGRIKVTGPAMASGRTARGAFIRALDSEIRGIVRDMKNDLNRQMWGDGSGVLARYVSGAGGTTLTVKHPFDFANQATRLKGINLGDRVAIEDVSAAAGNTTSVLDPVNFNTTQSGTSIVSSIGLSAKTFQISSAIGGSAATFSASIAAGDGIVKLANDSTTVSVALSNFRGAVTTTPNEAKEMMGLCGLFSGPSGWAGNAGLSTYTAATTTGGGTTGAGRVYAGTNSGTITFAEIQNLEANALLQSAYWAANMFFNAGAVRPLTSDLMQQGFDASEEIGQATPSIMLTSYAVRRKIYDLLVADRRYVKEYEMDGGFKAIDWNGVPIVPDKDAPEGALFFVPEDHVGIARASDFYWLDKDGAILQRSIGTAGVQDAWEAVLSYYAETYTDRRNALTVIGDIAI